MAEAAATFLTDCLQTPLNTEAATDDDSGVTLTPPNADDDAPARMLDGWEQEVGMAVAERLWARARENLRAGVWSVTDLEWVVLRAEARLTARQRACMWEALSWDVELAELAAGIAA